MSAEEGEAGPACGETRGEPQGGATIAHTCCEQDKPHGLKGQHPNEESGEERGGQSSREPSDASAGNSRKFNADNDDGEEDCSSEEGAIGDSRKKTQAMHSNCSSESCIPTPSCRICFQGAEQVNGLSGWYSA